MVEILLHGSQRANVMHSVERLSNLAACMVDNSQIGKARTTALGLLMAAEEEIET